MKCHNHTDKDATGTCAVCGEFFCDKCLVNINGKNYCQVHATQAFSAQPIIINNTNTNFNSSSTNSNSSISPKSKIATLLLCIFFGVFGIHRFYVGKVASGILYFFTCGIFCIGWFIDIISIACGRFTDGTGLRIVH